MSAPSTRAAAGPLTHVLLFYPRFVDPIRSGAKAQTLRPSRVREVRPGDVLSLRAWSGRPYHSPQVEIVPPVVCVAVDPVALQVGRGGAGVEVAVSGRRLSPAGAEALAVADGFDGLADFEAHWRGLKPALATWSGVLIRWEPGGPEGGAS